MFGEGEEGLATGGLLCADVVLEDGLNPAAIFNRWGPVTLVYWLTTNHQCLTTNHQQCLTTNHECLTTNHHLPQPARLWGVREAMASDRHAAAGEAGQGPEAGGDQGPVIGRAD